MCRRRLGRPLREIKSKKQNYRFFLPKVEYFKIIGIYVLKDEIKTNLLTKINILVIFGKDQPCFLQDSNNILFSTVEMTIQEYSPIFQKVFEV